MSTANPIAVAPSPVRARTRRLRMLGTMSGRVGLAMVLFVVLAALVGPFVAPHSISQPLAGLPGSPPSSAAPLGTDFLARDVLSRLLHGGVTVLYISLSATFLAYLVGVTVGLVAGFSGSIVDPILMRIVDLALSFPALLFMLVLIAAVGSGVGVLIVGVTVLMFPGIARIVRSATLEVSVTGYVEAAIARGERLSAILRREVFPNIIQYILTDFGLRFTGAVIVVASVNYLGLGLQPPTADWGLMISENRQILATNPWAVLAPAIMLGLLTIGVNLLVDAYARTLGRGSAA
jgi:peptide/nickel transport system permease protein